MATTAAATIAATAIYKYTYTLGRSLYVPLTSRCNSIPLPATRGPGFVLPRGVADALVNVRNAELPGSVAANYYEDWGDEDRVDLPPYDFPLVNGLHTHHDFDGDNLSQHLEQQRQLIAEEAQNGRDTGVVEDSLQPSIGALVNEVASRLDDNDSQFDQVVIAGEGEPTLRMDALLAVARSVQSSPRGKNNAEEQNDKPSSLPVRVITNGLCYGIPNFGYSPYNRKRNGTIIPMLRNVILCDMREAGISRLSVALNTANRQEYDMLMEPCCHSGGEAIGSGKEGNGSGAKTLMPGTAHDVVCELILDAAKLGMDVEITGIDRPGIDKRETDRLARLLCSVGPKRQKPRTVRWRKYFD